MVSKYIDLAHRDIPGKRIKMYSYDTYLAPDASKVPPSRFQKRKGSIYAVPGSRDGHVDSNYASKYYEKLLEKGYSKK